MTTFRSDAELAHTTPVSAAADGSRLMPARELGEDLARRLLAAALPTDDRGPLLSMLDEAPALFRSIRARVEIVRTKPGCAVVRTAPGANGSNPCELVAGFLQALPRLTYGVSGSLIENTCVRRGGRACLFTLLWDASLHTRRDPVVGQAPVHSLDALASVPPVDSIAPPVPLLALEAEAPSLHATPLDAVPLHATPLDAVPLQAPPPDEPPVHLTPLAVLPDDGHELRATEPKKAKRARPRLWKTEDTTTPVPEREQTGTPNTVTEPEPDSQDTNQPHPEPERTRPPGWKQVRMRRRNRLGAPVWLKRRGWLLALAVVAGIAGGTWAANHQTVSYQARSTMVVQSGASAIGPGGAAEASQLAITYATVIPTDTAILQQAADRLGITEATLSSRLTVSVETGTAVFVIAYKAPTSTEAVAGAAEVARVVGGTGLPTSTIPTGTVSVVDLATTASSGASLAKHGKELGGVLGLIVGLILAIAAERADPRVDTAEDLASVVGVPASLVPDDLSPEELSRAIAIDPAGAGGVTVVPLA
ncbi:MAG: hypothetical protein WB765_22125, partial [Acidimicrobiales bacterium]